MSRYIDRGTFEELLVVNPAEAERALDVIRPLLDEFRTVMPAADLYFIVSHDRQTFADRFEYADVGVERDGVWRRCRMSFGIIDSRAVRSNAAA